MKKFSELPKYTLVKFCGIDKFKYYYSFATECDRDVLEYMGLNKNSTCFTLKKAECRDFVAREYVENLLENELDNLGIEYRTEDGVSEMELSEDQLAELHFLLNEIFRQQWSAMEEDEQVDISELVAMLETPPYGFF